jgi:DNA-binding response OmpR family regulator
VQLIILDLQMPVMNGWQFLTLLDSYVRLSTMPVLVVSAHPTLPKQSTYKTIVGCLKVPYRMEELLALVDSCCEPSRAPASSNNVVSVPARDRTPTSSTAEADVHSSPEIDITQK